MLFPLALALASVAFASPDSTSTIECPNWVIPNELGVAQAGDCLLTFKSKGNQVKADFTTAGLSAGGGNLITTSVAPGTLAYQFPFTVTAGELSNKFNITNKLGSVAFPFIVTADPDEHTVVKCVDSKGKDVHELLVGTSMTCEITPNAITSSGSVQQVYTHSSVFQPQPDTLTYGAFEPSYTNDYYTMTVTAQATTFIGGKISGFRADPGWDISVYAEPDSTTLMDCNPNEVEVDTQTQVVCSLTPQLNGAVVFAHGESFKVTNPVPKTRTDDSTLKGIQNVFQFTITTDTVADVESTGIFLISNGKSTENLTFWMLPDGSTPTCGDDNTVAVGGTVTCDLVPLSGGRQIYTNFDKWAMDARAQPDGGAAGVFGGIVPQAVANDFSVTFTNQWKGKIEFRDGFNVAPLILQGVEPSTPDDCKLSCSNTTLQAGQTITCTALTYGNGNTVWSKNSALSPTDGGAGGAFGAVIPAISKTFTFTYTAGNANANGAISVGVGNSVPITVQGLPPKDDSGLGGGAIAGIVIAAVVVLGVGGYIAKNNCGGSNGEKERLLHNGGDSDEDDDV